MRTAFKLQLCFILSLATNFVWAQPDEKKIIHDAEYYILEAQNGKQWAAEDRALDAKLADLIRREVAFTCANGIAYLDAARY